jgi:3D (Asp-Asp-Asp) domain-containing protein
MLVKTMHSIVSILAIALTTATVNAAPSNRNLSKNIEKSKPQVSQIEAVYAALIKEKPAKNFSNRKPALLKASFASKASTTTSSNRNKAYSKRLRVTATAYTSHVNQTDSTPNIAAWGDRLYPGMKSIAVSRDLLKVYGLKRGQKVRIKGLKGEYRVLDKMNKRWKKKIDIYMGMDKRRAFRWGRRKVDIYWN